MSRNVHYRRHRMAVGVVYRLGAAMRMYVSFGTVCRIAFWLVIVAVLFGVTLGAAVRSSSGSVRDTRIGVTRVESAPHRPDAVPHLLNLDS